MIYGGFWRRFAAHVIDGLVLNLSSWMLLQFSLAFHGVSADEISGATHQMLSVLSLWVLSLPYYTLAHHRSGRTLGKRALGLRVVDAGSGGSLTLLQSLGRTLGYLPSYAIGMIGFLMAGVDSKKRALHDRLAGTLVVLVVKE